MIDYRRDHPLTPGQARELYQASTLGQRRPIDDAARFQAMLKHANLVVSAWDGPLLVGIARCLSDFAWVTWLADLAVRQTHQRRGIGRQLIHHCQLAAPQARILLRAAPAAVQYYPHIGFSPATQAWLLEPDHHVI
ncbi:MAG: GNAT family N-acetyltransferase [Dokdonella sp.]|nr:MAG: GNAT family N-acetyltransferase [Dokdonella sp.]